MQFVVIIYNKEYLYSLEWLHRIKRDGIVLELSYKIKRTCIVYYYVTIDIHKAMGKLPIIPKRGFTLPNMNYCEPYNPLNKQLIYDKSGNILRYIQNPTGKTDKICAQHDVDYTLAKNLQDKHNADEKMINSINNLPYKDQQYGKFLVKNVMKSKKNYDLGIIQIKFYLKSYTNQEK